MDDTAAGYVPGPRALFGQAELRRMMHPRSVAVVGASETPGSFGRRTIENLDIGFPGRILPVNPRYREMFGRPCYASLEDLPEPPDCVILTVPREHVEPLVERAAAIGAGGVMLYSSGYAEVGRPERVAAQRRLAEIAARTGLPKPTVVRMAYTLCVLGYLRQSHESGKYALGDSVAALGITMVSNLKLRRIARPYMQDLANRYDISVSLGIRNGLSVLYVENCRSGAPLSLGLDLGARIPIAETAMGHALLAVMEPRERERLLAEICKDEGEQRWPQVLQTINAGCAHWRARGFTVVVRDWQTDIVGVGAAIRQPDGRVIAFNAGGSASKFPRELLEQEVGPQLARMVKGLESFVRSDEV